MMEHRHINYALGCGLICFRILRRFGSAASLQPDAERRQEVDLDQRWVLRSRSALPTTLTDESAMAAAAIMGESSNPDVG